MSKTADQLGSMKIGKTTRIRGQEVRRDGDRYIIDGEMYSIDDATSRLDQLGPVKSGVDYGWTVFIESPPGNTVTTIKTHRCRSKADHTALIEAVKKRSNYLWYGTVRKVDGRYQALPPFIIDWDSVPEHPSEIAEKKKQEEKVAEREKDPKNWDRGLSCPFCRIEVSSTPGRTLHVKAVHPERLEEYHQLLTNKVQQHKQIDDDDEDDVVSRQAESDEVSSIKCPFCGQKLGTTSGRTLHVQGKHPEKLQEYQTLLIGGKL